MGRLDKVLRRGVAWSALCFQRISFISVRKIDFRMKGQE